MKRVSITEAKNRLSALLDLVKAGEDLIIEERGRPIARVESIGSSHRSTEGRRDRLIRAGVLAPRRDDLLDEILNEPPIKIGSGVSVVDALLEERADGR